MRQVAVAWSHALGRGFMAGAIENQATSNCGTLLRTLASTANGMSLAISLRWKNWRGGRDLAWISRSHWIGSAKAATERRFLSYKDLAGASGADWSKVRYAVNTHLGGLVDFARGKGWPLLSAIIVSQQNVATGKREPATLRGFVEAAHALGYAIVDDEAFLREQQERVFAWAAADKGQQD